jgi:hypothetical protein
METGEFIPIEIFCRQHGIEISFISSLSEFGLVEVITVNESQCIPATQLMETEKLVRLHEELGINLEGIDVINHLLQRVRMMQDEIRTLKNTLRLYDSLHVEQ